MTILKRQSPVQFEVPYEKTEDRENWTVFLKYKDEGEGPWLVDLAHKNRFDIQNRKIDDLAPEGFEVPSVPGACTFEKNTLVSRMNGTQATITFLGKDKPQLTNEEFFTDVTEAAVFLALIGPNVFLVAEKLTSLDFMAPEKKPPFLYQGPFCHVPCQIVTLRRAADGAGGILISCSRGYAESMVKAILGSGAEYGLRPAGEDKFSAWMEIV